MRTVTVQMWANNGLGTLGAPCDVSSTCYELGKISWEVDERFTKTSPGRLTARVWDPEQVVWTWCKERLATQRDGLDQLLRPWITVAADGELKFTGLLDLQSIRQGSSQCVVDLAADDWSALLQDLALEGDSWSRTYPKGVVVRRAAGPFAARRTAEMDPAMVAMDGLVDIQVGDALQPAGGGAGYTVSEITKGLAGVSGHFTTRLFLRLQGWRAAGAQDFSFMRLETRSGDLTCYTVTKALTPSDTSPVYSVSLNTTDQIYPGDVLRTSSGAEIPIGDVDPERSEVTSWDPVTEKLAVGDTLTWTEETQSQLMFQDVADVIRRAVAPYQVDLSRLVPGRISRPILAWLPLRVDGTDLVRITELEPTLTQVRLLGKAAAWTGSPDVGWSQGDIGARYADWTCQQVTAPAMLMLDERWNTTGVTRARNRVLRRQTYRPPLMVRPDGEVPDRALYDPAPVAWPDGVYGYDYSRLRTLEVANPDAKGGASTLSEKRWTGAAWSAPTKAPWPAPGYHPTSLIPMPGVPATNGPVAPQGQALLALALADNGRAYLQLVHAGSPVSLALSASIGEGELIGTAWGAYLVGSRGYGRVSFQGGMLSLAWVDILDVNSGLIPTSMVALDADSLFVLAKFSAQSGQGSESKNVNTTAMLQLAASPNPADPASAIIFKETVSDGWPTVSQAVRDPSDPARILGLLGNRLFQISSRLPRTIERMKASGLTAAEFLEHTAQMMNALVIPRPGGTLAMVSRSALGPVIPLTVNKYNVTTTRVSRFFFSAVRVSGAQDDIYADAYGAVRGGTTLEISNHPFLWTRGGCFGTASSFADFCGKPRLEESQDWFYEDASTAAPWESLSGWASVSVNGGPAWILTQLSYDLVRGDATALLLEDVK